MDTDQPRQVEPDWTWRSERYAWWVVAVLAMSLTLSLADRVILVLMIEPIKRDLGLSDTQISLVHGLAFTLFYIVFSIPMGRVADRWSRRGLAALSVIGWSVMTMACSLTRGFADLFAARAGVGVGEAGLSPAAISLISDYFPRSRRARPMALMSIGAVVGSGLGLMFGGAVVSFTGGAPRIVLPVIGEIYSWQAVFIVLGTFGILFSLIFLTVREPVRCERGNGADGARLDLLAFLASRKMLFAAYFIGTALTMLVLVGYTSWVPSLLIRRHSWSAADAAYVYGAVLATAGLSGTLLAGWWADRLTAGGHQDGSLRVAQAAAIVAALPLAVGPLLPHQELLIGGLFIGVLSMTMLPALAPAVIQGICPNELRGQVYGLYAIVFSIFGYALGPLTIALFTNFVFRDEARLDLSLALTGAIFMPLSAILISIARRHFNHIPASIPHEAGARRTSCN